MLFIFAWRMREIVGLFYLPPTPTLPGFYCRHFTWLWILQTLTRISKSRLFLSDRFHRGIIKRQCWLSFITICDVPADMDDDCLLERRQACQCSRTWSSRRLPMLASAESGARLTRRQVCRALLPLASHKCVSVCKWCLFYRKYLLPSLAGVGSRRIVELSQDRPSLMPWCLGLWQDRWARVQLACVTIYILSDDPKQRELCWDTVRRIALSSFICNECLLDDSWIKR